MQPCCSPGQQEGKRLPNPTPHPHCQKALGEPGSNSSGFWHVNVLHCLLQTKSRQSSAACVLSQQHQQGPVTVQGLRT